MNRLASKVTRALVAAAAILVILPACAGGKAGPNMDVAFNPNPPRQGAETITVTLQDARREPMADADVTIATSMPSMSMSGPTVKAAQSRAGVYTAKLKLNFATQWRFDVTARSGGQSVTRSYTQDVK